MVKHFAIGNSMCNITQNTFLKKVKEKNQRNKPEYSIFMMSVLIATRLVTSSSERKMY